MLGMPLSVSDIGRVAAAAGAEWFGMAAKAEPLRAAIVGGLALASGKPGANMAQVAAAVCEVFFSPPPQQAPPAGAPPRQPQPPPQQQLPQHQKQPPHHNRQQQQPRQQQQAAIMGGAPGGGVYLLLRHFLDKDEAKELGAKWDSNRKLWYAPQWDQRALDVFAPHPYQQ